MFCVQSENYFKNLKHKHFTAQSNLDYALHVLFCVSSGVCVRAEIFPTVVNRGDVGDEGECRKGRSKEGEINTLLSHALQAVNMLHF